MPHRRQTLREEAVTAVTGLTTTGANAFNERIFPLEQTELPAWMVFTGNEEIVEDDMDGTRVRTMELIFIGVARATNGDALKDTLDTMLEELEAAVLPTSFTNITALDLVGVEVEQDSEETDAAQGAYAVTFEVEYLT